MKRTYRIIAALVIFMALSFAFQSKFPNKISKLSLINLKNTLNDIDHLNLILNLKFVLCKEVLTLV